MRFVTVIGEGVSDQFSFDTNTTIRDLKNDIQSSKNIDIASCHLKNNTIILTIKETLIN